MFDVTASAQNYILRRGGNVIVSLAFEPSLGGT